MSGDRKHPLFFNGLGDPDFTIEPTASDTSPKPSITLAFLRRDVPTPRPPSPRPPSPGAISSSAATATNVYRVKNQITVTGQRKNPPRTLAGQLALAGGRYTSMRARELDITLQ